MSRAIQSLFRSKRVICLVLLTFCLVFTSTTSGDSKEKEEARTEAQKFIDQYTATWNQLRTTYVLADWNSNTKIIEGDKTNANATNAALEKLAEFTGSKTNLDTATELLKKKDKLSPIQVKELEQILYQGAD